MARLCARATASRSLASSCAAACCLRSAAAWDSSRAVSFDPETPPWRASLSFSSATLSLPAWSASLSRDLVTVSVSFFTCSSAAFASDARALAKASPVFLPVLVACFCALSKILPKPEVAPTLTDRDTYPDASSTAICCPLRAIGAAEPLRGYSVVSELHRRLEHF